MESDTHLRVLITQQFELMECFFTFSNGRYNDIEILFYHINNNIINMKYKYNIKIIYFVKKNKRNHKKCKDRNKIKENNIKVLRKR